MVVAEAEARRLQRQEELELRQQQDAEYQAALLADQERERMKQTEAEQEAQRLEERQQQEQQHEAEQEAQLNQARAQVPPEPPLGGDQSGNVSVTAIRFVLPSGTKVMRRFYSNEKIAGLLSFLTVHFHDNEIAMSKNIGLSTNFPKKSYHENPNLTLEEAGLSPQAVLMVQDLDA